MTVVMKYLDLVRVIPHTTILSRKKRPHKLIIIMMVFVIFFDLRNNIAALFVMKVVKLPM